MADNDWKKRLGVVFSTNPDFVYEEEAAHEPATIEPSKQNLLVGIDRKGVDPKDRFILRSKFTVEYNVKDLPLNLFASVDYGCGLNYTANKWKYTLGEEWSINKKHKLTCFFRFQTEDDDDEPNGLMIGMGYKVKF